MPERLSAALADRYRIDRELGAGGMATVYLAEDLKHKRQVAIKVLRPELAAVIGAERFLAEITTTANLQHPHILPLHDSGQVDGTVFYVMPFVEGESLRERLDREKQLPVAEAVRIATEVAGALDYAHRHHVIHRDIKPANILLHDGRALVADFGIALAASKTDSGSRMTETGMSLGTPHYMSPEQAMGERTLDARTDVYALGCVLYEMLTGEPPFTGPTAQSIVAKVMTAEPESVSTYRKTVPAQVEEAVAVALAKLPADRFASAADLADALANPAGGGPGTPRNRGAKPATTSRAIYALSALSATLLVAAVIGWLRPAPTPATSRQRVLLWHQAMEETLAPGVQRHATQAAIAPDGSSLVYSDSLGDGVQLLRKLRDESDPTPLVGTEGGVSPFFSPDGGWIGYATTDGRLRKVPVAGGGSVTLSDELHPIYTTAGWLDDETIIFVDNKLGLRRIPAKGGTAALLPGGGSGRVNTAHIWPIPGSGGFLYTQCPGGNCAISSDVHVYDLATDSSRVLVERAAGAWYAATGHLLYTDRTGGVYAAGFDTDRLTLTSGAIPVIDGVQPLGFTISRSGSVLYSLAGGARSPAELVWVSRTGAVEQVDPGWQGRFEYPAISPDGNALAVSLTEGSTHLWIRRSDGTRQKLTQDGTVNWRPVWSRDGLSIAYVSNSGREGTELLKAYRMPVDGSAPAEVILGYSFGVWEVELSPDQQWLVVRSDEGGGNGNIRARRLGGDTALVPLAVGDPIQTQIALSPDGQWLAYSSDETGKKEVYVTSFPVPGAHRLVSRGGAIEPRWAHSGRELFFKSSGQLVAVDVPPGPTFSPGGPATAFPGGGLSRGTEPAAV